MENWLYDWVTMQKISSHYTTSESLPYKMFQQLRKGCYIKLVAGKNFSCVKKFNEFLRLGGLSDCFLYIARFTRLQIHALVIFFRYLLLKENF